MLTGDQREEFERRGLVRLPGAVAVEAVTVVLEASYLVGRRLVEIVRVW